MPGILKSPSWHPPCDVSVNVSAQRYTGEGTRKVVLKYENLAEHSTVQADLDPGGRQGSEVHQQHVYYQNQALADTEMSGVGVLPSLSHICLLNT